MSTSWSALFEGRRSIERRFGRIFDLPVVNRVRTVLTPRLRSARAVLDVGAGDRGVEQHLADAGGAARYVSVDPDPRRTHDHRSLSEITETFDLVVSLEVAEHIPIEELPDWFRLVTACVAPGGLLVLSTPNTFRPQEFLRDATHRTPIAYDQLGAWIELHGLRVESMHRVHPDPLLRKILRRYLFGWIFRLLTLDYARQVVVVARRPRQEDADA